MDRWAAKCVGARRTASTAPRHGLGPSRAQGMAADGVVRSLCGPRAARRGGAPGLGARRTHRRAAQRARRGRVTTAQLVNLTYKVVGENADLVVYRATCGVEGQVDAVAMREEAVTYRAAALTYKRVGAGEDIVVYAAAAAGERSLSGQGVAGGDQDGEQRLQLTYKSATWGADIVIYRAGSVEEGHLFEAVPTYCAALRAGEDRVPQAGREEEKKGDELSDNLAVGERHEFDRSLRAAVKRALGTAQTLDAVLDTLEEEGFIADETILPRVQTLLLRYAGEHATAAVAKELRGPL